MRDGDVMGCGWAADGQSGLSHQSLHAFQDTVLNILGTGVYQSSFRPTKVDLGSEKALLIASCSDSSFAVTGEVVRSFSSGL